MKSLIMPILAAFDQDPALQAELGRLRALSGDFMAAFFEFVDLMQAQRDLRQEAGALKSTLETETEALFATTLQVGNSASVTAAGRMLQAALSVSVAANDVFNLSGGSDLQELNAKYGQFKQDLQQIVMVSPRPQIISQVTELEADLANYPTVFADYLAIEAEIATLYQDRLEQLGRQVQEGLDAISTDLVARQNTLGPQGSAVVVRLNTVMQAVGIAATLGAILAAYLISQWITRPIARLAETTDRLANGDEDVTITGTAHQHELGRMARALNVFRETQIERKEAAAERARLQATQSHVVGTLQRELDQLAQGDLTREIAQEFAADYDELRKNYNAAVASLHKAILQVNETANAIAETAAQTNAATGELSQRTENQAATLEQTAAALDELTSSVKSAADHAKSVDLSVGKARTEATKNREIVAQAVAAMSEIETSSKQISQVINVIDDIAFQTNLLALNAGVEAARAGESGKGFAVVASEVRALAQRSAEAAKEISALIANSSRHVKQGTTLVGNAGDALSEIITQVNDIANMTAQIATSAEEQAIGLSEINIGVNQLDQVTQQNAAMVQDSISRGDNLAKQSETLNQLIRKFQTKGNVAGPAKASTMRPGPALKQTPAPKATRAIEQAIQNTQTQPAEKKRPVLKRAAAQNHAADDMWEHF
ncbi:MAG: methyl-accepting chemotaxis protein [Yoonia sp.]|uniref:methyl-accepting chemotaxis protein n=1 Tax=Yoonia sp. TaxID=2212373 RepID=UPI003EF90041